MALLETRGLSVAYGGIYANDAVDLTCEPGTIVGLIGPNGAGKTTFIDAITGFTPLTAGSVSFDGTDLGGKRPNERAQLGLLRTFQSLELFEDLTVSDNLMVAAERPRWYSLLADVFHPRRNDVGAAGRVEQALDALGIRDIADTHPGELSHGQRKLVGVARALAASPKLLLLDEPAAGLDTAESRQLGDHLRSFLDLGVSLFLIDHDMGLVLDVCDDVYVLDFGKLIAHGPPADIRTDPVVIAAYLGESTERVPVGTDTQAPGPNPATDREVARDV